MENLIEPHQAAEYIKERSKNFSPKVGLILGSGLSGLASQIENPVTIAYSDVPGFAGCSVTGHAGALTTGYMSGIPVVCFQGRPHYYEGKSSRDIQMPIRTLKLLGCEFLILTNAAASLRQEVVPGNLVIIKDHINFQFHNPLVGPNDDNFGPRFPSLQNAYDDHLIELTSQCANDLNMQISTGIYLATLGPCYETPAEIRAFKILGADVVGMSTVPEVIMARHCNLKVLAISTITNMACGMSEEHLTHEGVLAIAKAAANDLTQLISLVISKF